MAAEVYAFACTIPAGTSASAPVTIALPMPERVVQTVEWTVPPGPAGLMGWALGFAGTPVIPTNRGGWIVTDDEQKAWPVSGYPTTGAWQFTGYNTGQQPHTVYLRFQCDPLVSRAATATVPLIPAAVLAPAPATLSAADAQAALDAATAAADTEAAQLVSSPDGVG